MGDQEVGVLEILRDGDVFIPLVPLAELIGLRVVSYDGPSGRTRLATPLGMVSLVGADIVEVEDVRYLTQQAIEQKLTIPLIFNARERALHLDLPWDPATPDTSPSPSVALAPDLASPRNRLTW